MWCQTPTIKIWSLRFSRHVFPIVLSVNTLISQYLKKLAVNTNHSDSESKQVFFIVRLYLYCRLSNYQRRTVRIPLIGLPLPHFCVCPKPYLDFQHHMSWYFFVFIGLRREMAILHFVDICGILQIKLSFIVCIYLLDPLQNLFSFFLVLMIFFSQNYLIAVKKDHTCHDIISYG